MALGLFALQSRIYATLNGDSNLTSTLGASIYDDVPQGSAYPFVSIGEEQSNEYGTMDLDGMDTALTIHVWSRYDGAKQTKDILDRIHTLLHDSSLSVTGFNLVNLRFEFSDIMRDPDGVTRHGVIRFRATILGTS
tara:strand:- start:957 stop:1364 length:408 start_codon:yes stop_codon:yes gene_type:complete